MVMKVVLMIIQSSYDPHIEPVVDWPDAIEVRTGEEDIKGWNL
jgi:hypothetical protein